MELSRVVARFRSGWGRWVEPWRLASERAGEVSPTLQRHFVGCEVLEAFVTAVATAYAVGNEAKTDTRVRWHGT